MKYNLLVITGLSILDLFSFFSPCSPFHRSEIPQQFCHQLSQCTSHTCTHSTQLCIWKETEMGEDIVLPLRTIQINWAGRCSVCKLIKIQLRGTHHSNWAKLNMKLLREYWGREWSENFLQELILETEVSVEKKARAFRVGGELEGRGRMRGSHWTSRIYASISQRKCISNPELAWVLHSLFF